MRIVFGVAIQLLIESLLIGDQLTRVDLDPESDRQILIVLVVECN